MRSKRLAIAAISTLLASWPSPAAPQLKYVAIVSRHGVRAPTWDNARLDQYSAQPWPQWGVAPGELTPHGATLIQLMGAYYREWLITEHLIDPRGCGDAGRIHIVADTSQRTVETGRAFAESLAPGCGVEVHSQTGGRPDALFSGAGTPDPALMLAAVRERLGANPERIVTGRRAAFDALQAILRGKPTEPAPMGVALGGKSVELTGPFALGSTFSEDLLLEYANGMEAAALGWGRLTRANLERVLEIHAVYADLMRRTPYLARSRGSNLLAHISRSLEQAAAGQAIAGAIGRPGDALLLLAGHDTNLSNLSGMLGLTWKLTGYQPDDTPPGGALIFSLWRDSSTGQFSLKLTYLAQSLDQMRRAERLSLASPPESQDLMLPGCGSTNCPWETARRAIENAIDPEFIAPPGSAPPPAPPRR